MLKTLYPKLADLPGPPRAGPNLSITHTHYHETMAAFLILVNHKVVKEFSEEQYEQALEEAAQLYYMYNSPELNDGQEGTTPVEMIMNAMK